MFVYVTVNVALTSRDDKYFVIVHVLVNSRVSRDRQTTMSRVRNEGRK